VNNLFFQMFSPLGSANGTNTYTGTSTAFSGTADFSTVLSQLNKNLDSVPISSDMNSLSFGRNSYTLNNTNPNLMTPDINAIVEKIKTDKSSTLDVESQVEQYLLSSYGGNKAGVIKSLSGVQNLPTQAITMQDQIFREIVSKISSQVGENLCKEKKSSDISYFADDSADSSTEDDGLLNL